LTSTPTRRNNVGNLGAYQDIVVKAKDAGGVEKLIESIEKSAALKAMPKGFAAGVAATIAAVAAVKQYSKRSAAREAQANEAKARLASIVDEASAGQDAVQDDKPENDDEGPHPSGAEGQP
jgi:hypothetical protein